MLLQIIRRGIGPLHLRGRSIRWRTELDWGPVRGKQTAVKCPLLILKKKKKKARLSAQHQVHIPHARLPQF